jgi:DinB superfamily
MVGSVNDALWQQHGGAIAMLDNALAACPDELWTEPLWEVSPASEWPTDASALWSVAAHTVRWLERNLAAASEDEFSSLECAEALTSKDGAPIGKSAIRACLATVREHCHDTLMTLRDEELYRPVTYDWISPAPISYLELQIYGLRHLQEHTTQLSLFLGQNGIPDEALDWVPRAGS